MNSLITKIITYGALAYIIVSSSIIVFFLGSNVLSIIGQGNLIMAFHLLFNVAVLIINIRFFLKLKDHFRYSYVLLFDGIYCLIYSFAIKTSGILVNDYIGFCVSFLYYSGPSQGVSLNFNTYGINIKVQYYNVATDPISAFEVNLIMIAIAVFLLKAYNSLLKSNPESGAGMPGKGHQC